jgi:hypothetical protein
VLDQLIADALLLLKRLYSAAQSLALHIECRLSRSETCRSGRCFDPLSFCFCQSPLCSSQLALGSRSPIRNAVSRHLKRFESPSQLKNPRFQLCDALGLTFGARLESSTFALKLDPLRFG